MSGSWTKWVRAAIALVVLGVLVFTVRGWWTEYQSAPRASTETSATAEPAADTDSTEDTGADADPAAKTVRVVLTEGLNFREEPDATGKAIRGLKKGEKVTVVKKSGDWFQVTTVEGETGWITDNASYTREEK